MNERAAARSLVRRLYLLCILIPVLLLAACGKQATPQNPDEPEPIIPETTRVADAATRQALVSFDLDSGELRFSTSSGLLESLQPDDVLVSLPSDAAPNGYLRKVKSLRTEAGQVIVETTQANLIDAIHQGSLDEEFELEAADLEEATPLVQGLSIGLNTQDVTAELPFRLEFDQTLIDLGSGEDRATLQVSGSVDFSVSAGVGLEISGCWDLPPVCLDRFAAWVGFEQSSELDIAGNVDGAIDAQLKIGELRFSAICFSIGPVPVCFVPTAYVHLGASGEVSLEFEYAVRQEASARLGAEYRSGSWRSISQDPVFTTTTTKPFTVNAGLYAEAWLQGEVGMMLYGIAGPVIGMKLGVGLGARMGRDPFWRLQATFEGHYGLVVDLPVLGRLVDHSDTLFSRDADVAESTNAAPVVRILQPTNTVQLGDEFYLYSQANNGVCSGVYCVFDREDGDLPFTLSSDVDGTLSPTAHIFPTPGLRTITVSAQDSHGAQASGSFTVDVVNSPPTVFGYAPADTVQATVPFYISASATDPNSELSCSALSWSVSAPDTVTNADLDEHICYAEIIFNAEGERTVTLVATDPQGATSTPKTFTLLVTAPPLNEPPVITELFQVLGCVVYMEPCDAPVPEGGYAFGELTLTVRAEDPDGVTYSFFAECLECADTSRIDLGSNTIGDLGFIPPELALWRVGVTVSDGFSSITMVRTVRFTVLIL